MTQDVLGVDVRKKAEPEVVFENAEEAEAQGYVPVNDALQLPGAPRISWGRRMIKKGLLPFGSDLHGRRYVKSTIWQDVDWKAIKPIREKGAGGKREKLPSKMRFWKRATKIISTLLPDNELSQEDIDGAKKVATALLHDASKQAEVARKAAETKAAAAAQA